MITTEEYVGAARRNAHLASDVVLSYDRALVLHLQRPLCRKGMHMLALEEQEHTHNVMIYVYVGCYWNGSTEGEERATYMGILLGWYKIGFIAGYFFEIWGKMLFTAR